MRSFVSGAAPTVAAALLCAPLLAGCEPHETPADIIEARDDPAVQAASQEALRTIGVFWARFDAKAAGVSDYAVKLAMKTSEGGTEFIWAEPLSHSDTEITARLVNDPVYLTGVRYGSVVHAAPTQISDWAYTRNDRAYGHFTTRALMKHATPEQRAEALSQMASTPLEAGDR